MAAETDHYAVLGVLPSASLDEIRGAYRRAARASHPDLNPGDAGALERFKRVQVAYEVLVDPARRDAYDRSPWPEPAAAPASSAPTPRPSARRRLDPDGPVSLARELGETVRAIRVHARRSGFARRVQRLIRYLESLDLPG